MTYDQASFGRDECVERLLHWHDQAKTAGRELRAASLLDLAWHAYDQLPREQRVQSDAVVRQPVREFELAA